LLIKKLGGLLSLKKKYSAFWNITGYNVVLEGVPTLKEFIPSQSLLAEYSEIEGYMGVSFIFDNIDKYLWVYQVPEIKAKGWVKKFVNESSEKKLKKMTFKLFENELNLDVSEYFVRRADEDRPEFEKLFMYEIAEFPLYTKHYFKPEYEVKLAEEKSKEEVKEVASKTLKECPHCGWVVSQKAEICPKCKKSLLKLDRILK